MKKALVVARVVKTHIMVFHVPYLKLLKELGFEVHVCAKNDYDDPDELKIPYCDRFFDLPFEREPFKRKNLEAYRGMKKLIKEQDYELIHCHTPVGGAIARVAAKNVKNKGSKVVYTAHGFHFFKGAPLMNWLLYYPIEKHLSRWTDALITINEEDYEMIIKRGFHAKYKEYTMGVGVDLEKFHPVSLTTKKNLRETYGYSDEAFIIAYVAEMVERKNHQMLIDAMKVLVKKIPQLKLLFIGQGKCLEILKQRVKNDCLDSSIDFMGFRHDVADLMRISDIAVSASSKEGLPVNVMEAMASGLPMVVTNCRGNRQLVAHEKNGYVVEINDIGTFCQGVEKLQQSEELRNTFGKFNLEAIQRYDIKQVVRQMKAIYRKVLVE